MRFTHLVAGTNNNGQPVLGLSISPEEAARMLTMFAGREDVDSSTLRIIERSAVDVLPPAVERELVRRGDL